MTLRRKSVRNGIECSWVVPRWAVDVTEVIYYINGQMEDKKLNDFAGLIIMSLKSEQWPGLDSNKTSKFFLY